MICTACLNKLLLYLDGADHDGLDYSREVGIPLDQLKHLIVSCLSL